MIITMVTVTMIKMVNDNIMQAIRSWQKNSLLNIIRSFDESADKEIFTEGDLQDYLSYYSVLHNEFKVVVTKDDVSADIVFEMELVKQIVVNIDYILNLIKQYHDKHILDKEIPAA